jgi:hypothetical protein
MLGNSTPRKRRRSNPHTRQIPRCFATARPVRNEGALVDQHGAPADQRIHRAQFTGHGVG